MHRLRAVLDAVPRLRDSGTREQRRGGARRRRSSAATNGVQLERLRPVAKPWAKEVQRLLAKDAGARACPTRSPARYDDRRRQDGLGRRAPRARRTGSSRSCSARLAEFPLARTKPFFDAVEAKPEGRRRTALGHGESRGVQGLQPVRRRVPRRRARDGEAGRRRSSRSCAATGRSGSACPTPTTASSTSPMWTRAIGVLSSLLLKKDTYRSMVGGDGACMGCGEKTAVHLDRVGDPRVDAAARRSSTSRSSTRSSTALDAQARELLASGADLDAAASAQGTRGRAGGRRPSASGSRALNARARTRCATCAGATSKGRAATAAPRWAWPTAPAARRCGAAPIRTIRIRSPGSTTCSRIRRRSRSACSRRTCARWPTTSRRCGAPSCCATARYDAAAHEPELAALDLAAVHRRRVRSLPADRRDGRRRRDARHRLPEPLAAARLGQADPRGGARHAGVFQHRRPGVHARATPARWPTWPRTARRSTARPRSRKELALLAIAHRGVYVHQSSQASASHLIAGVLKGLHKRRPALFNIYTPCPVEHGLADDWSQHAARLALESRAFPFLTYDPDAGPTFADCLSLDGNPSIDDDVADVHAQVPRRRRRRADAGRAAHDRGLGRHRRRGSSSTSRSCRRRSGTTR